jgi:tetratricopeptide (TPR) repeat protein
LLPETDQQGSTPDDIENSQARADLLAETCSCGSNDPDHHYRLGLANLELFSRKQAQSPDTLSLAEARTILDGDRFKDPEAARAWLEKLYGPDLALLETAHASFRRSLECCPLNGQAYVRLAQLCFLDGVHPPQPFCKQALLVRPNDPDVHLQVGLEAWLAGDLSTARECWANACRWQPDSKWKFLPIVAEQLSAEQAADFVPMDFEGLKWLARKESESGRRDGLPHVIEQAQKAVEADPERSKSAGAWVALHELYQEAHLESSAEACLRQAIHRAPRDVGHHLLLIRWLMTQERWEDALEQAQTARRSFPQTTELQNLVQNILAMKTPSTGKEAKKPIPSKTIGTDRSLNKP